MNEDESFNIKLCIKMALTRLMLANNGLQTENIHVKSIVDKDWQVLDCCNIMRSKQFSFYLRGRMSVKMTFNVLFPKHR